MCVYVSEPLLYACSCDISMQQMFPPLTSQLCHWLGTLGLSFCSHTTFLMSSMVGSEGTRS